MIYPEELKIKLEALKAELEATHKANFKEDEYHLEREGFEDLMSFVETFLKHNTTSTEDFNARAPAIKNLVALIGKAHESDFASKLKILPGPLFYLGALTLHFGIDKDGRYSVFAADGFKQAYEKFNYLPAKEYYLLCADEQKIKLEQFKNEISEQQRKILLTDPKELKDEQEFFSQAEDTVIISECLETLSKYNNKSSGDIKPKQECFEKLIRYYNSVRKSGHIAYLLGLFYYYGFDIMQRDLSIAAELFEVAFQKHGYVPAAPMESWCYPPHYKGKPKRQEPLFSGVSSLLGKIPVLNRLVVSSVNAKVETKWPQEIRRLTEKETKLQQASASTEKISKVEPKSEKKETSATKLAKEHFAKLTENRKVAPFVLRFHLESLLYKNLISKSLNKELKDIIYLLLSPNDESAVAQGVKALEEYNNDASDVVAVHIWGMICHYGVVVETDYATAEFCYKMAADRQYAPGMTSYALLGEQRGHKTSATNFSIYWEAHLRGCEIASFKLIQFYLDPKLVADEFASALLIHSAKKGYPPALYFKAKNSNMSFHSNLLYFLAGLHYPPALRDIAASFKHPLAFDHSLEYYSMIPNVDKLPSDFVALAELYEIEAEALRTPQPKIAAKLRKQAKTLELELKTKEQEPAPLSSRNEAIRLMVQGQKLTTRQNYFQALILFKKAKVLAGNKLGELLFEEVNTKFISHSPAPVLPSIFTQKTTENKVSCEKSEPHKKETKEVETVQQSRAASEEFVVMEDQALEQFILLREYILTSAILSETGDWGSLTDLCNLLTHINKLLLAKNIKEKCQYIENLRLYCQKDSLERKVIALGIYILGLCDFYQLFGSNDRKFGLELISKAAEANISLAHNFLGLYYSNLLGEAAPGYEPNPRTAATFLYNISAFSEPGAINYATLCLDTGIGVSKDSTKAHELLQAEAYYGSPLAKAYLAKFYGLGRGNVHRDIAHAKLLYKEAYWGGVLWAHDEMMALEASVQNSPKMLVSAEELPFKIKTVLEPLKHYFTEHQKLFNIINTLLTEPELCPVFKALEEYCINDAKLSDIDALALLGFCYQEAIGIEENTGLALACYTIIGDHPLVNFGLASLFEQGSNPFITSSTIQLLEQASEFIPEALCKLGTHYCRIEDTTQKSEKLGVQYFQKACDQLYPEGYTYLGLHFISRNKIQRGLQNLETASQLGSPRAKYELTKLKLNTFLIDKSNPATPASIQSVLDLEQQNPGIIESEPYALFAQFATTQHELVKMSKYRKYSEQSFGGRVTNKPYQKPAETKLTIEQSLKLCQELEGKATDGSYKDYLLALQYYNQTLALKEESKDLQEKAKQLFFELREKLAKLFTKPSVFKKTSASVDQSDAPAKLDARERANTKDKRPRAKEIQWNTNKIKLFNVFTSVADTLRSEVNTLISEKALISIELLEILADHLDSLNTRIDTGRKIILLILDDVEIVLDKDKSKKLLIKLLELEQKGTSFYSKRGKQKITEALRALDPKPDATSLSLETDSPADEGEGVDEESDQELSPTSAVNHEIKNVTAKLRTLAENQSKLKALKSEIKEGIESIESLAASSTLDRILKQVSSANVSNHALNSQRNKFLASLESDKRRAEELEAEFAKLLELHHSEFEEISNEEAKHKNEFGHLSSEMTSLSQDDKAERKLKLQGLLPKVEESSDKAEALQKKMKQYPLKLSENLASLKAIQDRVDGRFAKLAPQLSISLDSAKAEAAIAVSINRRAPAIESSSAIESAGGRSPGRDQPDSDSGASSDSDGETDKEARATAGSVDKKENASRDKDDKRFGYTRAERQSHHERKVAADQEAKRLREETKITEDSAALLFSKGYHASRSLGKMHRPKEMTLADKTQVFEKSKIREETTELEKIVKTSAFNPDASKTPARLLAERNAFLGCSGRTFELLKLLFPVESEIYKSIEHVRNVIFHSQKNIPLLCKFDKKTLQEDLEINEQFRHMAIGLLTYMYQVMNSNETELKQVTVDTLKYEVGSELFNEMLAHEIPTFDVKASEEQITVGEKEIKMFMEELNGELDRKKTKGSDKDQTTDLKNVLAMFEKAIGFSETRIATSVKEIEDKDKKFDIRALKNRKINGGEPISDIVARSTEFRHVVPLETYKARQAAKKESQAPAKVTKSIPRQRFI